MADVSAVKLIWVETSELTDGVGIKAHSHDYYHLFYIINGECTFSIQNKTLNAFKGSIVVALPGSIHALQPSSEGARLLEIKFALDDAILIRDLSDLTYPLQADTHTDYFIRYIICHGRSRLPYFEQVSKHYLYMLLIHITKDLHNVNTADSNSQLIDTTGFSNITVKIIVYIEDNYMREISLDILANEFDYNKHYICTAFKKDTSITIIDYLNFVRIRHAAELFSYSDADLLTVCKRVGFTNLSHFNHTFKKLTGAPPGYYRRMFPVDVNGNLQESGFFPSKGKNEIQKISEILGIS